MLFGLSAAQGLSTIHGILSIPNIWPLEYRESKVQRIKQKTENKPIQEAKEVKQSEDREKSMINLA